MILISYDGSRDSAAAIERMGRIMPGAQATVINVWVPFLSIITSTGALAAGAPVGFERSDEFDAAGSAAAADTAAAGAQLATEAGLQASPRAESSGTGSIAQTILAVAAEIDAELIVVGTRGLGTVKSFVLGSVSGEIVAHADRPVVVAPSEELAERRREWFRRRMAE